MKRKKINYGTAMNGQEAIDKWRAGNYHLILVSEKHDHSNAYI